MIRALILLSVLAFLGGCTPTIRAETLRFHQGLELGTGKSFAIVAEGTQHNNLEFKHYAELVNAQLQQHGLRQAASLQAADYRVYFSYGSDGGRQYIASYPDYGLHGGIGTYGDNIGIGVGSTFYDPYRYRSYADSYVVYNYRLDMRMEEMHSGNKNEVFQGHVSASGDDQGLNRSMPCLVRAMFDNFPGPHGVEQNITLPLASCRN